MKTTGNPPQWAIDLTEQVCKDYRRSLPELAWRNRREKGWVLRRGENGTREYRLANHSSSGTTYPTLGLIRMRAGSDEQDAKLVLLHELAHHLVAKSRRGRHAGHSLKFWRTAFELFQRYGIDMEYAIQRERHYKAKAEWVIAELNN